MVAIITLYARKLIYFLSLKQKYRNGGMIMANYNYFNQYKSEMERIKVKTAHDEHKIEFRDMCAKMISDAIPEIKA